MGKSRIEWTDRTWNPVTGCTHVSAGCDNCYAASMTKRLAGMGQEKYQGLVNPGKDHFNGLVKCHAGVLETPLRRKKPTMYFVNSMSDLFHRDVPVHFVADVFNVMKDCPHHTFQVLTKRPERMFQLLGHIDPLPNVWLGTSVENQEVANERVPHLLGTPATVRFLSCEPLLGPVNLGLAGIIPKTISNSYTPVYERIHWVIAGGESGPHSRTMNPEWARAIRDECHDTGTAFFFKQWGAYNEAGERVGKKKAGRILDGQTWSEMPEAA